MNPATRGIVQKQLLSALLALLPMGAFVHPADVPVFFETSAHHHEVVASRWAARVWNLRLGKYLFQIYFT